MKNPETGRTLYLLRHAEAENTSPDQERRLTETGKAEARRLGLIMRERKYRPELIYCSTARRTRDTLNELKLFSRMDYRDEAYNATAEQLFAMIRNAGKTPSLLVLAHNPGIHTLAAGLIGQGDPELLLKVSQSYPPATLAVLTFDGAWEQLGLRGARLASLIIMR